MATSNYQLQMKNSLIAQAQSELDYVSGKHVRAHMEQVGRGLSPSSPLEDLNDYIRLNSLDMEWFRLLGFRKSEDSDSDREEWHAAMRRLLHSSRQKCRPAAFLLVSDQREMSVFYGMSAREFGRNTDKTGVRSVLDSAARHVQVIPASDPFRGLLQSREGGVILGGGGIHGFDSWDRLLNSVAGLLCFFLFVCSPAGKIQRTELQNYYNRLNHSYGDLRSIQTVTGKGTQRIVRHPLAQVDQLLKQVKMKEQSLLRPGNEDGLFQVTMWYGAETRQDAETVGERLAALSRWRRERYPDKELLVCPLSSGIGAGREPDSVWVPWASWYENGPRGINDLANLMTLDDAAAMLVPPQEQRPGFYVRSTEKTSRDRSSFDVVQTQDMTRKSDGGAGQSSAAKSESDLASSFTHTSAAQQEILLGAIEGSGLPYRIPIRALNRHCSIGGKTGYGKTVTSHTIITQLNEQGISPLIIEPLKKEHWELVRYIPNLKIYSAGGDARPLRINPMEPEAGIAIGNHVDNLVRALESYVDLESPLNEAFQGLFLMTYRKAGWQSHEVAGSKNLPFPTLKDAQALVDEYIETETRYSRKGEVHGNVRGALHMRLKALTQGTMEAVISCKKGVSMKELLESPTVIELDDLGWEVKLFLMNILMSRLFDYLRQQPTSRQMKRLLVIEEAHNIFRDGNHEKDRSLNQYFDQLMTTIRASGTGVMVLDQRISRLNQAVISNTAVRINHQVDLEEEVDAVAGCMGISEFQKKLLPDFQQGECVAKVSGQNSLCQVRVATTEALGVPRYEFDAHCVCCVQRETCIGAKMRELAETLGETKGKAMADDLESCQYNPKEAAYRARQLAERHFPQVETKKELLCLTGFILRRYGSQNEKIIRKIAGAILLQ